MPRLSRVTALTRPNIRPVVLPDDPALAAANQQQPQQPAPPAKAADNSPMFYGLFRSGGEGEQVAPVVNALWGTPPAAPTPPGAGNARRGLCTRQLRRRPLPSAGRAATASAAA